MFKGMQEIKKCFISFNVSKKTLRNSLPCPVTLCFSTMLPQRAQGKWSISEKNHSRKVKCEQKGREDFPNLLYSYRVREFLLCG